MHREFDPAHMDRTDGFFSVQILERQQSICISQTHTAHKHIKLVLLWDWTYFIWTQKKKLKVLTRAATTILRDLKKNYPPVKFYTKASGSFLWICLTSHGRKLASWHTRTEVPFHGLMVPIRLSPNIISLCFGSNTSVVQPHSTCIEGHTQDLCLSRGFCFSSARWLQFSTWLQVSYNSPFLHKDCS